MASSTEFVDYVSELLAAAGRVTVKRMFGGHGVYLDGLFMAIVVDDELYLKVDEITRADFDAQGCAPFVYSKDGKSMTMGYLRAPGEAMDAPHLMQPWARRALEAALRAHAAKTTRAKPATKTARVKAPAAPAPKKKSAAKRKSRRGPTTPQIAGKPRSRR
jgi:DNA transformation protein